MAPRSHLKSSNGSQAWRSGLVEPWSSPIAANSFLAQLTRRRFVTASLLADTPLVVEMFTESSVRGFLPRFAADGSDLAGQFLNLVCFCSSYLSYRPSVSAIDPSLSGGYGFPRCLVALAIGVPAILQVAQKLLVLRRLAPFHEEPGWQKSFRNPSSEVSISGELGQVLGALVRHRVNYLPSALRLRILALPASRPTCPAPADRHRAIGLASAMDAHLRYASGCSS